MKGGQCGEGVGGWNGRVREGVLNIDE